MGVQRIRVYDWPGAKERSKEGKKKERKGSEVK